MDFIQQSLLGAIRFEANLSSTDVKANASLFLGEHVLFLAVWAK
jgi:hypothetical protein